MRAWWEEDEGRRSRFFKNTLGFSEPPPATCDPRIAHIIIQQHLEAPSVWAIFPIQVCFFFLACCARRSSIWVPNKRNWELVSITLSWDSSPTVVCVGQWEWTKEDSIHTNMTSILFMFLHLYLVEPSLPGSLGTERGLHKTTCKRRDHQWSYKPQTLLALQYVSFSRISLHKHVCFLLYVFMHLQVL